MGNKYELPEIGDDNIAEFTERVQKDFRELRGKINESAREFFMPQGNDHSRVASSHVSEITETYPDLSDEVKALIAEAYDAGVKTGTEIVSMLQEQVQYNG